MTDAAATASYIIHVEFDARQSTFRCRDDQTIQQAAENAGVMLPSSCCTGVCTTCAARISEGIVEQPDAMGIKPELQEEGFTLLCVAYPRSNVHLRAGQEDILYEAQFGQYQK